MDLKGSLQGQTEINLYHIRMHIWKNMYVGLKNMKKKERAILPFCNKKDKIVSYWFNKKKKISQDDIKRR